MPSWLRRLPARERVGVLIDDRMMCDRVGGETVVRTYSPSLIERTAVYVWIYLPFIRPAGFRCTRQVYDGFSKVDQNWCRGLKMGQTLELRFWV
jgi:hypothetical protein